MGASDAVSLDEDAFAGAILLCVLAQSTGPMDQAEKSVVHAYLVELAGLIGADPPDADDPLLSRLFDTKWTIKSLQAAAEQLLCYPLAHEVFPRFFAEMAVARAYRSSERRLAIKRIQAALRRAQKGK